MNDSYDFNYTAYDAMDMVDKVQNRLRDIHLVDPDITANLALIHEYIRRNAAPKQESTFSSYKNHMERLELMRERAMKNCQYRDSIALRQAKNFIRDIGSGSHRIKYGPEKKR